MQRKNNLSESVDNVKPFPVLRKKRSGVIRFPFRTNFLYSRENYNKLRLFSFHINESQAGRDLVSFLYPKNLLSPLRIEPYNVPFARFRFRYLCYCGRSLTLQLDNEFRSSDPMRYNPLMKIVMDRRSVPRMPRPKSQRFDALSAIFAEFAKPHISYMGRAAKVPFRVSLNNILELNRPPNNLSKLARGILRHRSPLSSDDKENEIKFQLLTLNSFCKTRIIWRGFYTFAKQALRDPVLGKLGLTYEFFKRLFRDFYWTYSRELDGRCNRRRRNGPTFREIFTRLEKDVSSHDYIDPNSYLYAKLQDVYLDPINNSLRPKGK